MLTNNNWFAIHGRAFILESGVVAAQYNLFDPIMNQRSARFSNIRKAFLTKPHVPSPSAAHRQRIQAHIRKKRVKLGTRMNPEHGQPWPDPKFVSPRELADLAQEAAQNGTRVALFWDQFNDRVRQCRDLLEVADIAQILSAYVRVNYYAPDNLNLFTREVLDDRDKLNFEDVVRILGAYLHFNMVAPEFEGILLAQAEAHLRESGDFEAHQLLGLVNLLVARNLHEAPLLPQLVKSFLENLQKFSTNDCLRLHLALVRLNFGSDRLSAQLATIGEENLDLEASILVYYLKTLQNPGNPEEALAARIFHGLPPLFVGDSHPPRAPPAKLRVQDYLQGETSLYAQLKAKGRPAFVPTRYPADGHTQKYYLGKLLQYLVDALSVQLEHHPEDPQILSFLESHGVALLGMVTNGETRTILKVFQMASRPGLADLWLPLEKNLARRWNTLKKETRQKVVQDFLEAGHSPRFLQKLGA